MTRPPAAILAAAVLTVPFLAGGCGIVDVDVHEETVRELRALKEAHHKLQLEAHELRTRSAGQAKRIQTLEALGGPARLAKLFTVARIDLGKYTGGADTDDKPGHEVIRVFLQPVDQDADVLKAAGSAVVQVYDLAQPEGKNLLGEYRWDVDQLARKWNDMFLGNHYALECPWKSGPPVHDEITLRVEFTELLTGKTFRAQKVCKIELPPAAVSPPPAKP